VRRILFVLLVLALGVVVASVLLFVRPREDEPARADAILVLAGNVEGRLPEGLRLWREGVAPTLVLSRDLDDDFPRALCRRPRVICFDAKPYSTIGEAESFAPIARRHRWKRVLLVSSRYHVTRARMLFSRCVDAQVLATGTHEPPVDLVHGLVWEWPKLGYSLTVKRDC
jgi:uncharacterized SAM-binding protein YcdF (DUF218 family)